MLISGWGFIASTDVKGIYISFDISRWSFIRTPYGKVHCEHNVRFQTILLDICGFLRRKMFSQALGLYQNKNS